MGSSDDPSPCGSGSGGGASEPPAAADPQAAGEGLDAALRRALATMRVKDAADAVAGALGLPRRTVYARALELKADA